MHELVEHRIYFGVRVTVYADELNEGCGEREESRITLNLGSEQLG